MNNWIEISEANLAANFRVLRGAAGDATEVLAVVKANGYGHGAERCAVALAEAGAQWLGVTCVSEGVRVRQALTAAGLRARLLVMCGFFAEEVETLREHNLTPVVWMLEQVAWLAGEANAIHVEIDTGMSRQGVPRAELPALLAAIQQTRLKVEGVLTHFASSEEVDSPLTRAQQQRFAEAVAEVARAGLRPALIHAGASSAIDYCASPSWLMTLAASVDAQAMVRPGIALYGFCMALTGNAEPAVRASLQPVMTWKARVLSVRSLAVGETIGYNATYEARAPMRIALLPVGFADGLRRELSSTNERPGGWVMLAGERANILGRISMNLTVVDITAIPNVRVGDEATLLGAGVTADDHARLAETTAYEILCGIHPCG